MPQVAATRAAVLWHVRLTWLAVGVAVALTGVASIKLYRNARAVKAPAATVDVSQAPNVPIGESFDGIALPDNDVRVAGNRTALSLARGCVWGVPGRLPYKGTVRQALIGARLPEDVVNKIDAMVARGIVSDRVDIRADSIRTLSGKRRFDTTIVAMAYGESLCFGTRVNFHPGHVERADLYDATDAAGKNFAVMVPYVCGNASVLAERAERPEEGRNGTIPEPATLASLLAGLAAMFGVRSRRKRVSRGRAGQ